MTWLFTEGLQATLLVITQYLTRKISFPLQIISPHVALCHKLHPQ